MSQPSKELPGLRVSIDRLVYFHDTEKLPPEEPHAFIYFITIGNLSDRTVTLNGRRWVITEADGHQKVIEGDGIVGKEPTIAPGESFTYNSYHTSHCSAAAEGSFHGVDSNGEAIHVRIPKFEMRIPPSGNPGTTSP